MIKNPTFDLLKKYYKGSKRYFISSLSFPSEYRDTVAVVYNFCRLIDDSVDEPHKVNYSFEELETYYKLALKNKKSEIKIIDDFVEIKNEVNIENDWVEALFNSMRMDIRGREYRSLDDTLEYVYGVAEVVGLMMCKVLDIEPKGYYYAQMLGRSAQWINFLRDIPEDIEKGRVYFPRNELTKFGLDSLSYEFVAKNRDNYIEFMNFQSDRFYEWTKIAESGYKHIPTKVIKPIIYSTELDKWKMDEIMKDPFEIYRKKINPSTMRILTKIAKTKTKSVLGNKY